MEKNEISKEREKYLKLQEWERELLDEQRWVDEKKADFKVMMDDFKKKL
eukprot:CAMPEP_0170551350 /NCGR_PEP_ID=MMETSP0211-20121228/9357_1 /TAXON_ID=311385 /ORGANISM="Pseudokeronopsis sp., Strain OXSARD2" /LENGTH=48 /DNA_ID=CAMNT_0010858455 /DNA_START=268 /DNA_END=417 /DNA_ORIENTATION=+